MTDVYKAPEAELRNTFETSEFGSMEKALAGDFEIQPAETIKQAWGMLKGMKTTFWLATIVYVVIAAIVEVILGLTLGYSIDDSSFDTLELLGSVISTLIMGPFVAGMYMIVIKHSVGASIEVGELFNHFDKILPMFFLSVLMTFAVVIGFFLLIVPGIYLMIAFSFAMFLLIEKDMGPLQALSVSRKVVHFQWFQMAGLVLLCILICLAGIMALLVGALWAIPLAGLAITLVYRDVFGIQQETLSR